MTSRNILNIDSGLRQINPRSGSSVYVDLVSDQFISGIKNFLSNLILEWATLECNISPQIAIFIPVSVFLCCKIVKASVNAWVGCSLVPSPALIKWQSMFFENNSANIIILLLIRLCLLKLY